MRNLTTTPCKAGIRRTSIMFTAACVWLALETSPLWPQPAAPRTERPVAFPPTNQRHELFRRSMLAMQEVQLPLPIFATVSAPGRSKAVFYTVGGKAVSIDAPATVGLRSRHRYAFALDGAAGSVDRFYGTIEILRGPCLPHGVKPADVPLPIRFNDEDIVALANGGMITKLLVIEDAERSSVDFATATEPARYESFLDERDAIRVAKDLGAIVAVVRIGSRVPSVDELSADAAAGTLLVPSSSMAAADSSSPFVFADSGAVVPAGHRHAFQAGKTHSFPAAANMAGACGSLPAADCNGCGSHRCEACFLPAAGGIPDDCVVGPYVCDGGDRKPKVDFAPGDALINLHPEDTVAVFRTKNGPRKIIESNRVCVYSPKFAEVRLVQAPEGVAADLGHRKLEKDLAPLSDVQVLGDRAQQQVLRHAGIISRKRASVYASDQWPTAIAEIRVLAGFDNVIRRAENAAIVGPTIVANAEQAVLAKRVEFAQLLTNVQMPQLAYSIAGANEIYRVRGLMELERVEERPGKPRVKLEKFASVAGAQIGEKVRFTIKFTNVGKETVHDVVIVDSLHARLDYVSNSADGPFDSVFTAQSNEVGSMTLRWQLKNPLEPGQEGTVSFEAILR